MKILVIDFSLNNDLLSSKIIDTFIGTIRTPENTITTIKINEMKVETCRGCPNDLSFNYKEECLCVDDMNKLYPQFRNSDIWLFVIPMVNSNTIKFLKNIFDRMEPLFQPVFFMNNGNDSMPQESKNNGKIALISTCNKEYFAPTIQIAEELSSISMLFSREYAGALIRNNITELNNLTADGGFIEKLLNITTIAAIELTNGGNISIETIKSFTQSNEVLV